MKLAGTDGDGISDALDWDNPEALMPHKVDSDDGLDDRTKEVKITQTPLNTIQVTIGIFVGLKTNWQVMDDGETDQSIADGDGGGLHDGVEDANHNGIVDDGEGDPLNPDTNNDGWYDGIEDGNGNGIVDENRTDPLSIDSDSGGESDGNEA